MNAIGGHIDMGDVNYVIFVVFMLIIAAISFWNWSNKDGNAW